MQITGRRYEAELGGVHAELEAKNSKLEAVRLRSTDVENDQDRRKTEADTSRALATARLVSTHEDQITRGLVERI